MTRDDDFAIPAEPLTAAERELFTRIPDRDVTWRSGEWSVHWKLRRPIEAAHQEVLRLARGPFRMTVPVKPADSDIVLVAGLEAGKRAVNLIDPLMRVEEAARLVLERLVGEADDDDHWWAAIDALRTALADFDRAKELT